MINNDKGRKRISDNDLWAPPTSYQDSSSTSRLPYSSPINQIHHHNNRFTCSGYQTMIWSFVSPGAWTSSREMPARLTVKRSENTFSTVYQVIDQKEPVFPKFNEIVTRPQWGKHRKLQRIRQSASLNQFRRSSLSPLGFLFQTGGSFIVQWQKLPKDSSRDADGSNDETDLANGSAKSYGRPDVHHL